MQGTTDKNLKFLVTAPDSLPAIDVDVDAVASATEVTLAQASGATKSGFAVTFTVTAHSVKTGDAINVATAATAGVPVGACTATYLNANTL